MVNLQVIQQVHSAGGGGECGGHCSDLGGCSAGHSDWEVGTQASRFVSVCVCECV